MPAISIVVTTCPRRSIVDYRPGDLLCMLRKEESRVVFGGAYAGTTG
jgi:hypothetical protein